MAYICVLFAKQARGTNLNKNISGKFLILILSDGPMIDYNRKSVGLGLPIATIIVKLQQSIVIGSGTQSTCNWFSHCYYAV